MGIRQLRVSVSGSPSLVGAFVPLAASLQPPLSDQTVVVSAGATARERAATS